MTTYNALQIAVMAAVTALLRFLPFWLFGGKRKVPKLVTYLGTVLPCAMMGMLVIYCLKAAHFDALSGWLPELIAVSATAAAHLWKRNTLFSILCGTVCYMLLKQFIFV